MAGGGGTVCIPCGPLSVQVITEGVRQVGSRRQGEPLLQCTYYLRPSQRRTWHWARSLLPAKLEHRRRFPLQSARRGNSEVTGSLAFCHALSHPPAGPSRAHSNKALPELPRQAPLIARTTSSANHPVVKLVFPQHIPSTLYLIRARLSARLTTHKRCSP